MPKIMKLTDVGSSDAEVEPYLTDFNYILQQKFDGTRIQAQWDPMSRTILFSNTGEGPVTHSAAKLKLPALEMELTPWFSQFDGPVVLEGELLIRTGEFVVWDLLVGNDPDRWDLTASRIRTLELAMGGHTGLTTVSPTAWTTEEKRALWARINEAGVEGAVSKRLDSRYEPGVRSKQWLKHKLCVQSDLVVLTAAREFKPASQVVHKGSASLGVYEDGVLKQICSASLIGKDLTIAPGDVVVVEYLYREPGGGLVQPRIVTKRWDALSGDGDKKPGECTETQFPDYSRSVV